MQLLTTDKDFLERLFVALQRIARFSFGKLVNNYLGACGPVHRCQWQSMKRSRSIGFSMRVARCRRPSSFNASIWMLAIVSILIGPALVSFRDQDHSMCGQRVAYLCCRQASRGKFCHAKARVCSEPCYVDVRLQWRENRPIKNELASSVLSCVMPIQQSHHLHLRRKVNRGFLQQ